MKFAAFTAAKTKQQNKTKRIIAIESKSAHHLIIPATKVHNFFPENHNCQSSRHLFYAKPFGMQYLNKWVDF
jgi:hypothetical protein